MEGDRYRLGGGESGNNVPEDPGESQSVVGNKSLSSLERRLFLRESGHYLRAHEPSFSGKLGNARYSRTAEPDSCGHRVYWLGSDRTAAPKAGRGQHIFSKRSQLVRP